MTNTNCAGCGAAVGEEHGRNCGFAVCLWTGGQRYSCGGTGSVFTMEALDMNTVAISETNVDDASHDCGRDVWAGESPGDRDAARLGFWCYWGPPWIRCGPDHPGAVEDTNRLRREARWDRRSGRWERLPSNIDTQ